MGPIVMMGEGNACSVRGAEAALSALVPLRRVQVIPSACFVMALCRVEGALARLELIIQATS